MARSLAVWLLIAGAAFAQTTPLLISSISPLPPATALAPYSFKFEVVGGTGPYLWSISGIAPAGLLMKTETGVLEGTPTDVGTQFFTVVVQDVFQNTGTKRFELAVAPPLELISDPSLAIATVGVLFFEQLVGRGGNLPYQWSADRNLPPGLVLDPAHGTLSGAPESVGTFSFVVTLTDAAKATATKTFRLTVQPPVPGFEVAVRSLTFRGFVGGDWPPAQAFAAVSTAGARTQFSVTVDGGSPGSPPPRWLLLRPQRGGFTPTRFVVSVDTTGLAAGTYRARLYFDGAQRQFLVPVTLEMVDQRPQLEITPGFMRFTASPSTPSPEQLVIVRNAGGGSALPFRVQSRSSWIVVTPTVGQAGPNAPGIVRVTARTTGLAVGLYRGSFEVQSDAGSQTVAVLLFVSGAGPAIGLSSSGVRFDARAGQGPGGPRSILVSNVGSGTLRWRADLVKGGEWLTIGAGSGVANPGAPNTLPLSANPGALAAGDHYALVRISDPQAINSPQYLVAVLRVARAEAAPLPDPATQGLVFVTSMSLDAPPAQRVQLHTSSTAPVAFQAAATTDDGANWLDVTPTSGTAQSGQPGLLDVSVQHAILRAGVFTGEVTATLSSTQIRSINVTLIVLPVGARPSARAATGCTPARLTLTHTGLTNSFSTPALWPVPLRVRVADDCGDPVTNAVVSLTFSNGDPAVPATLSGSDGSYSATWVPRSAATPVLVTARAVAPNMPAIAAQITGTVAVNQAPLLAENGTVNAFSRAQLAPLAPGTWVEMYGADLSTGTGPPNVIPFPTSYQGTSVIVGGSEAPLSYVSPVQVNAQIPMELVPDRQYQVVVSSGTAISVPETIAIAAVQPGVTNLGGRINAQHGTDYSLITAQAPARPGEHVILYLVGMGVTDPSVGTNVPAPSSLARARVQPTVTIGGRPAQILFAGLTPGAVGLYQINLLIPVEAGTGDLQLLVTQGGFTANETTIPVRP